MAKNNYHEMDLSELKVLLIKYRKKYLALRFRKAMFDLKDQGLFIIKETRREVARILTVINQKNNIKRLKNAE